MHFLYRNPVDLKHEKITNLYPASPTHIHSNFICLLHNSKTAFDFKLKLSAFLSCVDVSKCVKCFKVGISRTRRIMNLCQYFILVLSVIAQEGEWSKWSQWSTCSVSCGYGIQKRQKAWQSNNPRGPNTDTFTYSDIMECFTNTPCPSKFLFFDFGVLFQRY